jgi:hypothetical protein
VSTALVRRLILLCSLLGLLASAFAADEIAAAPDVEKSHPRASANRHPEPTYSVQVGLDNEIFPAFANFAALQKPQERTWGTVVVKIANPTDAPLRTRVSVTVRGWSDEEIQLAEMAADIPAASV